MIYIADPNLKNLIGHYFEYDRSIAVAAKSLGRECTILSHRDAALPRDLGLAVEPLYSADIWKTLPGDRYDSDSNLKALNETFYDETYRYFVEHPLQAGDVVFIPTITKGQLLGAARLVATSIRSGARFVILLRYQRTLYDGPIAERAFRLLEKTKHGNFELCTDSHRLAEDLGPLTSLPFRTYPIPHTDHIAAGAEAPREDRRPVHFVSLGNARGEKGMAEILAAARNCETADWGSRVRFTIQCNDPSDDIRDALNAFALARPANTTLIDRALDTREYYDLLRSADVVLVPYHHAIYSARTSGVFLEAVNAGKVAICTRSTWMSDLLQVAGGGVAVADQSAPDVVAAIKTIVHDFPAFDRKARVAAEHWRHIHSPVNLVSHLLGAALASTLSGSSLASADIRLGRRAAIIFPWGDVISGRSGATTRLKYLIHMLEQHYDEIRVLFPGEGSAWLSPQTFAESHDISHQWTSRLKTSMDRACEWIWRKDKSLVFHLWNHIWPRFDKGFDRHCEAVIRWADDVYLEYSYFAPNVARHCRTHGKSVVVTQYDILSEQAKGLPLIYQLTRLAEFNALKLIPRVIVATEYERQLCAEQGIQAEVIPHPIDARKVIEISPEDSLELLRSAFGLDPGAARICLFVGGDYGPNRRAAERMLAMARAMRGDAGARDIMFVVAGPCMAPKREANFAALGLVENITLAALYRLAALTLIPLAEGTGSSIKSIEALARGQLTLSTPVGMRGLDVQAGKHCFIEPDIEAFPSRIKAILNEDLDQEAVRANASAFGARFDYRTVFEAYGFPEHVAKRSGEAANPEREASASNPYLELLQRAGDSRNSGLLHYVRRKCPVDDLPPAELAALAAACARAAPDDPETMRLIAGAEEAEPANLDLRIEKWRLVQNRDALADLEAEASEYLVSAARLNPALLGQLRSAAWKLFHNRELKMTRLLAKAGTTVPELTSAADLHYLHALATHEIGGDTKVILSEYTRALELGFDPNWIYYHRGRLRLALGEIAGRSDLEQAIRLGGDAGQSAAAIVRALGW